MVIAALLKVENLKCCLKLQNLNKNITINDRLTKAIIEKKSK